MAEITHVMNDIETLGTGNDALILSIGAVKFNALGVFDSFHMAIDVDDAQCHGMTITAGTVLWWMGEDKADARRALLSLDRRPLHTVLAEYQRWYGEKSQPTWGNGATFDNVIMRSAFRAIGEDAPWQFWHDRCYRTMKDLPGAPKMKRTGVHHSALDDARSQADHLLEIWHQLGIGEAANG